MGECETLVVEGDAMGSTRGGFLAGVGRRGRGIAAEQQGRREPARGTVPGIREWSLKVPEERLFTGGSRSGSCYLILLSTLLRFIRQLLGALQYAVNGGRIVLRVRPDPAFTLFRLLPYLLVAAPTKKPSSLFPIYIVASLSFDFTKRSSYSLPMS